MTRCLKSWRTVRLSIVREPAGNGYRQPRVVYSGADVAELVREFIGSEPREVFVAVYLDTRHKPIAVYRVGVGDAGSAPVPPVSVFGPAVHLQATALVVAHNHPSGDPTPSSDDNAVTDRLREAGDLLGVKLLDHLVLGDRTFHSYASGRVEAYRKGDA